jgi:DNA-binding response OmpR family regulator
MPERTVLVVTPDALSRDPVAAGLAGRGFRVLTAAAFAEARRLLIDWQPDVLVTAVRLREHNGLHLAVVSRSSSVLTKSVIIGYADPVLQAEAHQIGAVYLVEPSAEDVIATVETVLRRRERRWPRGRANIVAKAADETGRLLDVSYGGFRIELPSTATLSGSGGFDLTVRDLRIPALPVWMKRVSDEDRLWCGAAVAADEAQAQAWRAFVDEAVGPLEAR